VVTGNAVKSKISKYYVSTKGYIVLYGESSTSSQ